MSIIGLYYAGLRNGDRLTQTTIDRVKLGLWLLVGPLIVLIVCWMIYALYLYRSLSSRRLPPLPDDAGKLFTTEPASRPQEKGATPHVQIDPNKIKDSGPS
jgi:hypothetical protein